MFPPGVDFAVVLGERGVRGVEADLEAELGEDEMEDGDGLGLVETPRKGARSSTETPKKTGRGRASEGLWPESSAKDVREVVGVLVDEEDDVVMADDAGVDVEDEDEDEEFVRPKKKSPKLKSSKAVGGSGKKAGRFSGVRDDDVPVAGPSTKRNKKLVVSDEESEEDDVEVKVSPVKTAMKPKATPKLKPKRVVPIDMDSDTDEDLPLAPGTSKKKPKKKPGRVDSDSDAVSPPIKVPPPTRILKSKAKDVVPLEQSSSPLRTPKRVVSVLIPPFPAHAAASKSTIARTNSLRATAGESRAVSGSNPKPSRPEITPDNPARQSPSSKLVRTPSKRSAANKATRKLREEVMPDVMNFQQEMKKEKGKGRDRRESRDDDGSVSAKSARKRHSDVHADDDGESEIDRRLSKKKKLGENGEKKRRGHVISDEENEVVMEQPRRKREAAVSDDESSEEMNLRKSTSKKTSTAVSR